jgi:hypothetical protein
MDIIAFLFQNFDILQSQLVEQGLDAGDFGMP